MHFRSMRPQRTTLAALAHRKHSGTIDVVPELLDCGMRRAPFGLEGLDFRVGEFIRLEFPPRIQAALISERQIAGLADTALRRVLGVGAGRHAEDLAGGLAVRLVARIAGRVKAAVGVELPLFAGNPRQHAAFDRAEIGADQHVPGRRVDHRSAAVAHDGERPRIQLLHMLRSRRSQPQRSPRRDPRQRGASGFAAGNLRQPSGRWRRRDSGRRRARDRRHRRGQAARRSS